MKIRREFAFPYMPPRIVAMTSFLAYVGFACATGTRVDDMTGTGEETAAYREALCVVAGLGIVVISVLCYKLMKCHEENKRYKQEIEILLTRDKLRDTFSEGYERTDNITTPKVTGKDEELMNKVDQYINDNLSETTLRVDALSDYVGLSRSQFHRRIKEIMGVSPSDYIRNIKLQKACALLRDTDIDISQVAYSLGFNAQSHFSTQFKRFSGLTPSEYRLRHKEDTRKP